MDGETKVTFGDLLRLGIKPVAGGEIDLGQDGVPEGGDLVPGSGEGAAVPDGAGADASSGFDLDGRRYTPDQIRDALEAFANKGEWEGSYKRRDQELAHARKVLEWVMQKPVGQFTEDDLDDLEAYGVLARRLSRDAGFRRQWYQVFNRLSDEYERQGVGRLEAERKAASRIARADAAQEAPPDVHADKVTPRIARLEGAIAAREVRDLQGFTDDAVIATLEERGKGLEAWHPEIRDLILSRVEMYDTADLVGMMYDGRLAQWIDDLADHYVRRFRPKAAGADAARQRELVDKSQALSGAKRGAPPVPAGSGSVGVPAVPELPEAKKGAGLKGLHARADRLLG